MKQQHLRRIHLGAARCAADLTDGSERAEYVPQAYLLSVLGRPLRSVNLMYCYYPLDAGFPQRAHDAFADMKVTYQWGYPYDDYFPYTGGLHGSRDGKVFEEMREIRAFGQDVTLTLTCDPFVSDAHLQAIAEDLRPFGRIYLRLNHEATGSWFAFNKRASYEEVASFFVHASEVIRKYAPNVRTILCIGGVEDMNADEMTKEKEFAQAVPAADIWSVDKYMALHYGWPYDVALAGGHSHYRRSVREIYTLTKRSYERFTYLNGGVKKPMVMSEFNADGDVTGPYEQCDMVNTFFRMVKNDAEPWLSAVNFYQFRDRGRLGLEHEEHGVGIPQPLLQTYRAWIHDELFQPRIADMGEDVTLPIRLRWGNAEDADGIAVMLHFDANPHFCELTFADDGNYMLELHGRWFHKAPQEHFVDLMPAFFEHPLTEPCDFPLRIFAPPADGQNDLSLPDGLENAYAEIAVLPEVRIEYAPVEESCL